MSSNEISLNRKSKKRLDSLLPAQIITGVPDGLMIGIPILPPSI